MMFVNANRQNMLVGIHMGLDSPSIFPEGPPICCIAASLPTTNVRHEQRCHSDDQKPVHRRGLFGAELVVEGEMRREGSHLPATSGGGGQMRRDFFGGTLTQGSSFVATAGLEADTRWGIQNEGRNEGGIKRNLNGMKEFLNMGKVGP